MRQDTEKNAIDYVRRAIEEYACRDSESIEIDADAIVSQCDEGHGAWVQAWVWVSDDD